ncbi:MAG TPA: hypothetical protein VHD84_00135 [Candidatus Saccharimonadales bacterium]|nr:hypothetical protein [Candidatus Saccharimonadales bacterium]
MRRHTHLTRPKLVTTVIGILVLAIAVFAAGTASAKSSASATAKAAAKTQMVKMSSSKPVEIVDHSFSPDTIQPGDTTTLSLTFEQPGREGSNAVVTITGLNWAGLTFVSNGDPTASCVTYNHDNTATCSYSDFAHSYKSDHFVFASDPMHALGTFHVYETVSVAGVGGDDAWSDITYAVPGTGSTGSTTVYHPQPSGGFYCYSQWEIDPAEADVLVALGQIALGNTLPVAESVYPTGTYLGHGLWLACNGTNTGHPVLTPTGEWYGNTGVDLGKTPSGYAYPGAS